MFDSRYPFTLLRSLLLFIGFNLFVVVGITPETEDVTRQIVSWIFLFLFAASVIGDSIYIHYKPLPPKNECEDCKRHEDFQDHLSKELCRAEEQVESSSSHAETKRKLLKADVAFWGSDWEGNPLRDRENAKYKGVQLCLLMNDTFGYACADSEEVPDDEVERVWEIHERWSHHGLTAWVAVRRDCDPIGPRITEQYRKAKKEIEDGIL